MCFRPPVPCAQNSAVIRRGKPGFGKGVKVYVSKDGGPAQVSGGGFGGGKVVVKKSVQVSGACPVPMP